MEDRQLARIGRALAATGCGLGLVGTIAFVIIVPGIVTRGDLIFQLGPIAIGLGLIGMLSMPSEPRNGAVWALTAASVAAAISINAVTVSAWLARDSVGRLDVNEFLRLSPSELPLASAVAAMIGGGLWAAALFTVPAVALLLFPDGSPPSPRWRWLLRLNIGAVVILTLALMAVTNPASTQSLATSGEDYEDALGWLVGQLFFITLIGSLLNLASLFVRYRRSTGDTRRQIQWVALGGVVFLVGTLSADINPWPFLIGVVALIAAFGVAITKYRLYDISTVVSKTVTYLSLAVVLVLLYGGAVLGYVKIFADEEQRATGDLGLALPLGATLLVAIAFEPVRARLQRLANRLVYGVRAEPHAVLTEVTSRLAESSTRERIDQLAELLRQGTAAESATVWLAVGDDLQVAGASPPLAGNAPRDELVAVPERSRHELKVPIVHGADTLGMLAVVKPETLDVTPADEALVADVARTAALALRNRRLNAQLEARAKQLRVSRRRLIQAHDAVRHRLERDLHDGAQQQVVACKVKLGLAKAIADREGAQEMIAPLDDLAQDADRAIDQMRRVARGIYPPLLEAEGIEPALRAGLRLTQADVTLVADGLGRHARRIEETVYFSILSAVLASKAAGAESTAVTIAEDDSGIQFDVVSDAPYEPDLTTMADRMTAFGGALRTVRAEGRLTIAGELAASRLERAGALT